MAKLAELRLKGDDWTGGGDQYEVDLAPFSRYCYKMQPMLDVVRFELEQSRHSISLQSVWYTLVWLAFTSWSRT